jgi:hypothetical protein
MGQSTRVEEASDEVKKLVSIIHRLPNEIKVHIFDHVAASQPEKYLHVIRPGHVHLFADDMLKHLPSIDTAEGLVHPALDWISLAEEAIVKNAIFHIETDFTIPFPGSMLQQSKHIHYLSLTICSFHDILDMSVVAKRLPQIKTQFPQLLSLDITIDMNYLYEGTVYGVWDPSWDPFLEVKGRSRMLRIMEGIQARKMLMVHDRMVRRWIWHG